MIPKLLFCGDTHGPLDDIVRAARDFPDHQLIHLGDLSPVGGPLEQVLPDDVRQRFWFIPGNHDYDREEYFDQTVNSQMADRNLHGRVGDVGGARVAGLGGIFIAKIWNPKEGPAVYRTRAEALRHCGNGNRWRGGLPRKWRSAIYEEDIEALSLSSADILVTHEAPSCHRHGFSILDDVAKVLGCSLVVHGHHHESYQEVILGGQVRVMGVGYRCISNFGGW